METWVITGANRGIGLELTKRIMASGRAVIAGCREPEAATGLRKLASSTLAIMELDVADERSVDGFVAAVGVRPVDVLVNNAGIVGGDRQSVDDMDYQAWMRAFEVNTIAPFRLTTKLKPNLLLGERPRAVTLSSQMGSLNRKSTGSFAYRSSKAAVNKVMQGMAMEFEREGIIVCPVHPGWVRTDMGGSMADISVEESAQGLLTLIDSLTPDHSGRFWTWDGKEHPW